MSDPITLSNNEILNAIKRFHRWELKTGVLYCFGIKPESFNWDDPENQNADPMRVYNWCCHVLNGGDHEYRRGQPKLTPVSKTDKDGQRFEVLRDILIEFSYYEWPDFTKRTYEIWKSYRQLKDGPSQSEHEKDCIHAMRHCAIMKFKNSKHEYLNGKKPWTVIELAKETAKKSGLNENTLRQYCGGTDVSLSWAKQNEENQEYQSISRKSL